MVEHRQDFPGCSRLVSVDTGQFHVYSDKEIDSLLNEAVDYVKNNRLRTDSSVHDDVYAFGASIIEQARKSLDALKNAPKEGVAKYEGPSEQELTDVLNGGIRNLVKTLKPFGDIGLIGWSPYLRVVVRQQPVLTLNSPRIDLSNVKIEITATGELWAKYPWFSCSQYCFHWEKVIKCDRIASITASLDIKAKLHADVAADGPRVLIQAQFDELRLDYPILRDIPLEGIANQALGGKPIIAYDAAKIVASIPVLDSKFTVDKIDLSPTNGGISIGVIIKKICWPQI